MTTWPVLKALFRLLAGRTLGARGDVGAAMGWEMTGILLGVAGPLFLKLAVDALALGGPDQVLLTLWILLFVLTWSGTSITASFKHVHTTRIIDKVSRYLIGDALRSQLPVIARERSGDTGRVLGLFERLTHSLQVVIDGLLWRAAPVLIQVVISLAVMAALVPLQYVLIMALVLGAYLYAAQLGAAGYQARAKAANEAAGALSQALGDVLRNARRIVFNGNLDRERAQVRERAGAKLDANLRTSRSLVRLSALQYGVVGAGLAFLLVLSSADVVAGRLTVGDFVLLQAYAFRLALPLSSFGFVLRQAGVSIANIADALDLVGTEAGEPEAIADVSGPLGVRLGGVGFRYGAGRRVLDAIDVDIAAGTFVVIVGPNGSGKSTLAQLIAGHLEPSEGDISIGGVALADVPRALRHKLVLYVPQYIGLFARSLRSNALYPPTTQTEGELSQLLSDWAFYDGGRAVDLDLMVGEQGERLSGGQIQKLELARLAGVSVPVMILDESTSSLDGISEARAIVTLRARLGEQTTLVLITHRPGLVEAADQVLYLRGGCLAAAGRHCALMASDDAYRAFWSPAETASAARAASG